MMAVQIKRFADNFSSRYLFGEGLLVKPGFLLFFDLDGCLRHCASALYRIYLYNHTTSVSGRETERRLNVSYCCRLDLDQHERMI